MKFTKILIMILVAGSTLTIITSCSKEDNTEDNTENNETTQELFFNFHTPDWERTISCENIDFLPTDEISEGVAYVVATSASTNATFGFPFPADSSAMALTSNIKKYSIADYNSWGTSDGTSFEISLKLNTTGVNDSDRLYSVAGFSDTNNFNEITSIEYIGSEANYANFRVKGNYKMNMLVVANPSESKLVTGSYCIKFRTHKQ